MNLENLRTEIDGIDDRLIALFEERMEVCRQVALIKKEQGGSIVNSARERNIVARLTEKQNDEMAEYTKILYNTIFDISRAYQSGVVAAPSQMSQRIQTALAQTPQVFPKSAVVACQGLEGANSAAACEKLFARPSIMYMSTFEGVFAAVDKGLCKYGILPLENSLHGSVTGIYDLMKTYNFYIAHSIKLKINHALLAKKGTSLDSIKTVYSHEQALAQCSEMIKAKGYTIIPCENTAIAAKMVSESADNTVAAISSLNCANLYDLEVICDSIQNSENNYTRFICISKDLEIYPGSKKVSLMLTVDHKPGSLYRLMSKFASLGINLSKLESRPIPQTDFEFLFYFDLDISVYDEAVSRLFSQLEADCDKFVFLGCYCES